MKQRTNAQRRWIKRGYPREMIPMRPLDNGMRYSYLLHSREDWRSQRDLANLMGMPIRPVCKQFLHNGRKP